MADTQMSNVLPFGNRDSAFSRDSALSKETSEDAPPILTRCRDRLAQGILSVFVQNLSRANDEFLDLANRATNLEQQQTCFSAMNFLANRTQSLMGRFQTAYAAGFDERIAALTSARPRPSFHAADELQLVDTDDFEQDLAIGKIAARAVCNCSQQLVALDRRFAAILHLQRISQDDNPLYPGTLFAVMLQTLTEMEVGRELAMALLQSFERQTAAALPGVYADLNRYLSESGVLPTIPVGAPQPLSGTPAPGAIGVGSAAGSGMTAGAVELPPTAQTLSPQVPLQAAHQSPLSGGAATQNAAAPIGNEDVFAQLLQAIQTANALQSANLAQQPAPPMAPVSAYTGQPLPARVAANQLVDALGHLQRGVVDPRTLPGFGAALQIDPAQSNVLQQIRATPMASWSHPMDAMTIDIVSMLFDAIFNDPDLSATMRAEIAKLQIPLLKVALLDKTFFSDRKHPARRLLDAIANSGIGRGEHDEPRLLAKIRSIVETVVSGFDSDIQIFSLQVEKLDEFLQDEEGRAQGKSTQMVAQLEAAERKEVAASRAETEIVIRIERNDVPQLIAEFIDRHWRLVLIDVFTRVGDISLDWNEAVRLMDELLWSVVPKNGAQERERLLALLPDLLKRLRQGLERLNLDGAWDRFFSELIRLHMAALRNDNPPAAAPADNPPAATVALQPPVEPRPAPLPHVSEVPATPVPAQPDSAPAAPAPAPASRKITPDASAEDRYLLLVQALEVGAWIEFQSFRGNRNTLRLNWVSEFKRVYLFTNRQGENSMTLAVTSLADHLRKGTARLLSQNPLTDRAVAQVLEKIHPASA